ncbi:unnamed protein product [Prunus brigantina]
MSSARIGRREAGLGSKKRGDAPPPFHGISGCSTPGESPRRNAPRPSPGRHAATRSRRGSSSSSPPTADGFGTGTPVPSPSQPILFPRLRIHFADFPCLHCSIDRPRPFTLETDAVMSTTGVNGTRSSGFSRVAGGAPDTTRRAVLFQPAGPYLRPSRFRGGQAVKPKR